jgi:hypothetical protein
LAILNSFSFTTTSSLSRRKGRRYRLVRPKTLPIKREKEDEDIHMGLDAIEIAYKLIRV